MRQSTQAQHQERPQERHQKQNIQLQNKQPLSMPKLLGFLTLFIVLMALTRSHHLATAAHLPDMSWALFFLAGFYLRSLGSFGIMIMAATAIDYVAVSWGGVSDFCITTAYLFLLPAYGVLYMGGRWFAQQYQWHPKTLLPLSISVFVSALLCELLSSGSFYLLSGHFAEASLVEFAGRVLQFFPANLEAMFFYIAVAALLHTIFSLAQQTRLNRQHLRQT